MGKKTVVIAIAAALLLGGGGAGAYFFIAKDAAAKAAEEEKAAAAAAALRAREPVFVQLEPLNVPVLRTDNRRYIYAIAMTMQVHDEKAKEQVQQQMPRIRDAFLRQVNGQPLEGKAGTDAVDLDLLKRKLHGQAAKIVGEGIVEDLLFHRVVRLTM